MYLKRLEIHGFKSFAQKTTLEFSQGIIAIVGPNGSGKSNVADALRWVLGEQSPKMIRGKKSDDVIFAGSDKKTRLGFAEVIATFDNADHRIPVDAAEVSIGRRVDRSGESEYLLNGNRVRLLDIIDLVLRSNIGTSRYTVISQGTIDNMILQGPPEIKGLIDEASGVKTYYIRRERTLRRLEQTAQNLMRAEDLIAEIEPRLKSLRRQAKKMEARGEIEQELKGYQRQHFSKGYWNLKTIIDGFAKQIGEWDGRKELLENKLQEFRKQAEGFEAQDAERNRRFKELQEVLGTLQGQKNKLIEDVSMIRGKMQSQKTIGFTDSASIAMEVHDREQRINELKNKLDLAKQEVEKLQQQSSQYKRELSEISSGINQLHQKLASPAAVDEQVLVEQWGELEARIEALFVAVEGGNAEEARAAANTAREASKKFKQSLQKSGLYDRENRPAVFQEKLQKLQEQKEELNRQIQERETGLSKFNITVEFLQKEHDRLLSDKHHLELELKKAEVSNFDDFVKELIAEEKKIQTEIDQLSKEIEKVGASFQLEQDEESKKQKALHEVESAYRSQQDQLSKAKDHISGLQIEKAKYDAQMQVLKEEVLRVLGEAGFDNIAEKPEDIQTDDLENKISRLKNQLEMIGGMDELTMKEYQETEARYTNLSTQVEDLKKSMNDLKGIMDELDGHIKKKFDESFHKINEKFEFYFRVLFNGGRAYLSVLKAEEKLEQQLAEVVGEEAAEEIEDTQTQLRPEEKVLQKYSQPASNITGIDIKATPPGKKLSSIQALSGGERALTSIALLCSLLACFPSPFVVLDEVDAALDEANTIRFGQILGTLANQTQFITITHNRETMSQSSMLYGVTMGDDGVSKLLSVKLDQAKQYAK